MNNKEHKFQVDEINKIKYKLKKYAELNNDAKVKEYVDHLKLFKIDIEILKETEIVGCLRELRAKQNSAYSSHASDLITAWKAKCNVSSSETANKSKPVNGVGELKKVDPAPVVNGHKTLAAQQHNGHDSTMNGKKRSISDLRSSESKPAKSSPLVSVKPDEDLTNKRQKLSYSDYKSSKTAADARDDSNYRTANFSSIDEYGDDNIEDEVNSSTFLNDIPKKTAPAVPRAKQPSERYSPKPFTDENDKLMKAPPVPLAPLSAILPSMPTSMTSQYSSSTHQPTSAYRPAAQTMSEYAISAANDEEFLDKVFKSRNSKKTLYVGKKKTDGTITAPKLYDLCVQSLRTSIDDLPDRLYKHNLSSEFPIAFDLLKPVLDKANAKQLELIESYSPHLMEDSDLLWKKLCESEFKKLEPPDEDETWRELYFKKVDEREEEFKRVRDIISSKQAVKPKERQTQLATMKPITNKTVANYSSNGSLRSSSTPRLTAGGGAAMMRPLLGGGNSARRPAGFGAPSAPQKSQGMKDTLKLLKKFRR